MSCYHLVGRGKSEGQVRKGLSVNLIFHIKSVVLSTTLLNYSSVTYLSIKSTVAKTESI